MRLPWDDIQSNAVAFSKCWKDAKSEKAQAETEHVSEDKIQVNVKATEKMAKLHNGGNDEA